MEEDKKIIEKEPEEKTIKIVKTKEEKILPKGRSWEEEKSTEELEESLSTPSRRPSTLEDNLGTTVNQTRITFESRSSPERKVEPEEESQVPITYEARDNQKTEEERNRIAQLYVNPNPQGVYESNQGTGIYMEFDPNRSRVTSEESSPRNHLLGEVERIGEIRRIGEIERVDTSRGHETFDQGKVNLDTNYEGHTRIGKKGKEGIYN